MQPWLVKGERIWEGEKSIAAQWMICIAYEGVLFIGGEDPLGPAAPGGAAARGGSNTRCCASPNPNPNGLTAH
jgi:hypothetical protein